MDKKIKIAFFGNTCNNYYQILKLMKKEPEFDLHLYIDNRSDPQQLPESDDPELKNNYPDWIHFGNYITIKSILFPWTSPLVKEFDKYDIVIVSHFGPVYTQFSKTPAIFNTLGADITVHPFAMSYINLYYPSLKEKVGAIFMSYWLKKGIRKSLGIWTQPFFPFVEAIKRLKIPEEKISKEYTPIALDLKLSNGEKAIVKEASALREKYDFILFHPSRIMLNDTRKMTRTGTWKANDLLVHAYKLFVDKNPEINSALVLIDRPASTEKEKLREIINDLDLNDKVVWLKPENGFGYSRTEIVELYRMSDVVADDFGVGWFGSIVVEALSLGVNVLCYVDENVMKQIYPWHPMLSSKDPNEMAAILDKLYYDSEFKKLNAEKGPIWVREFHTGDFIKNKYKKKFLETYNESART